MKFIASRGRLKNCFIRRSNPGILILCLGKARRLEQSSSRFQHSRSSARQRASQNCLGRFVRASAAALIQLDFYTNDDLQDIIRRSARLLKLSVPEEVVEKIAARSRATPRIANALLKRVRDFSEVREQKISVALSDEAFKLFGVDSLGLTKDDGRYLETLKKSFHGGPAGVRALAAALHEDSDTIEYVYEPYLLRLGFIERSPRGRILTQKGREYLGENTHLF